MTTPPRSLLHRVRKTPSPEMTGARLSPGLTRRRSASHMCMLAAIGLALVSLAFTIAGFAQTRNDPARARLTALLREGDKLGREAAALEAATRHLKTAAQRLTSAEKELDVEAHAMDQTVREYNAAVVALTSASTTQRQRCTRGGLDAQQVRECNEAGAKLAAQAESLEQRRIALDRRRQALNQRIERHNVARREWEQSKREHEDRTRRNESDIRHWLQRARAFRSTEEFAALAADAGAPVACSSTRLSTVDAAHPLEGLKRMRGCFKAVAG